jgi:hypothetical protein
VNGIKEKKIDFYYCSTARKYEDICGKEGKFYVKKDRNIFNWKND